MRVLPSRAAQLILTALLCGATVCADERTLTIGLLADLTGPSAINGESCRQGFAAAHAALNIPALRVVYGDHKGDAASGVTEYRRLTQFEHAALVVVNRGQVGMALNPLSRQDRIPLIGIIGGAPHFITDNPYAFRSWASPQDEARLLWQEMSNLKKIRTAIVTTEDQYTLGVTEALIALMQQAHLKPVFEETVEGGYSEFSTIVSRLMAAQPDAVFVNLSISQIGTMIKKLREQGNTAQIFSNVWASYPEVITAAGKDAIEGTINLSTDLDQPRFLATLEKQFGHRKPAAVTYACYVALNFAAGVFSNGRPPANSAELFQRLKDQKTVKLQDTELVVNNREIVFPLKARMIRDGEARTLE